MQIGDKLHETVKPVLLEKQEKYCQFVVCWISLESVKDKCLYQ